MWASPMALDTHKQKLQQAQSRIAQLKVSL
jgi:hypothetical protein